MEKDIEDFLKSIGKPMKVLCIQRGKSSNPVILPNGDKYDSRLDMIDNGKIISSSEKINTDPSITHPGGILAPDLYYGIYHEMFGYPGVVFFKKDVDYSKIKTWTDLTVEQRTFESTIPNPNHGNHPIITLVDFHIGSRSWDGSDGCPTYHPDDVQKFTGIFKPNEIMVVKLT
jgi:hypothetical protein